MVDTYTNFVTGVPEHELLEGYKGYMRQTIDFSATNATTLAVVQCLNVGAGMWVKNVRTRIVTPEGGTLTASLGDGAGAASWDASVNLNAAAGTTTQGTDGTDAYVHGGKYYSAADTIDLTLLTAATPAATAVIVVEAEYTRNAT